MTSRSWACPTSLKIWSGSEFIRWLGSSDAPLTKATLNSSGAVSPAARATASSEPVTMPGQRRGQDDPEDDPPARGAERQRAPRAGCRARGCRTTSAERVTTGSMSSASATAPFQAANVPPTFADDEDDVDEEPEDDRRHAGHHVDEVPHEVREAPGPAVLDEPHRHADAEGHGDRRWRCATISIVPRMADRDAARVAEEAAGRVGGEEVDAEGAEALLQQVVEDQDQRHERDPGERRARDRACRGPSRRRRALTGGDPRATALIRPSPGRRR